MIDRLEKKIGRFAIKNLIYYVLGGYAIGYILLLADSRLGLYQYITLQPHMVMRGQVWRLFTWILTPPQALSFWVIFMFMLYFFIGRALEQNLGTFRYNLYMFSGWFFMTLGAMAMYWITSAIGTPVAMNISTYYINMASFLAFAVLYPDVRVYFFGILPIKIKILAWIDVGLLGLEIVNYISVLLLRSANIPYIEQIMMDYGISEAYSTLTCITGIFSILISLLNFLIFFLMNRKKRFDAGRRKAQFERYMEQGRRENAAYTRSVYGPGAAGTTEQKKSSYRPENNGAIVHRCSVCGRTNLTDPNLQFRYCSKCSGNHEYCQDHLFTHVHIKN